MCSSRRSRFWDYFGTALVLLPLCALVGAGGGLSADLAFNGIVDAFASKDKEAAGFCIQEGGFDMDLDKYFGWAAWIDINGNGTKDGFDGMIIVIAGAALLLLLLKR